MSGRVWLGLVLAAALSCSAGGAPTEESANVGRVTQALTDTDGDGMDDDWETAHFGDLSQTGTGDFDADGMTNGQEFTYGFDPAVADALDDADGDRYPNVFEIQYGTNPNSASSTPTPTLVVDGAGGGTHTSVAAALSAVGSQSGNYAIVGIAAGVYTGANNVGITASSSTKKLLLIGLAGASRTVIEGAPGVTSYGWGLFNTTVVSSLTFRKMSNYALLASSGTSEFRFIDLLVHDNVTTVSTAGLYVDSASKTVIVGSTFANNQGTTSYGDDIYLDGSGTAALQNTVVSGGATRTVLVKSPGVTLTADHSLVTGQTLAGAGNLAGSTSPQLRFDYHLLANSPLRGAGGASAQSRTDMDLETRPGSAPDIGADQFVDADADGLADAWELQYAGNLTTLTSASADDDGDGLTNQQEYANATSPFQVDTDGDGLSDGEEVNVDGTNPRASDTDNDEMPDGWEAAHGLDPLVADALEDADGDRYPNIFEYAYGTDPSDRTSTPTPTLVVNGAGGGTHTNLSAALSAASAQTSAYVIVGIAPGTYTGANNVGINVPSTKKLLLIGLVGASRTIFENTSGFGWVLSSTTVVSSLTFRKMANYALYASSAASEFRFIDLLIEGNASSVYAGGLNVMAASKTVVAGSTLLDNTGAYGYPNQIYIDGTGKAVIENTVVWSAGTGAMLTANGTVSLTASHSLVKGQTLAGTGNLAPTTDPLLRHDVRLKSTSPLRGAGGASAISVLDWDLELRPPGAVDIGVDQWSDADADGLPDGWEIKTYGSVSVMSGSADDDGDGLSNAQEYDLETDPRVADTDRDGLSDGAEVALGTNPLVADADDLSGDLNHDGVLDSVGVQLGHQPGQLDDDGDSLANADEVAMCLDPLRADSDGDGVPDNLDAFPLDPTMSALSSSPSDVTPPVITLTAPWYAVAQ